jgi:hypothetical protein
VTTVQTTNVTEALLGRKKQLDSLLDQRKQTYGPVVVKTVLLREGKDWKNCLTVVEILHKDAAGPKDEVFEYPKFIVSKKTISLDELRTMAESLLIGSRLKIQGLVDTPFEGYFSPSLSNYLENMPSNDEFLRLEWPANSFIFEPKARPGLPNEPYVAVNAPLFAGAWEVVRVWTGIDCSRYNQFVGAVVFVLPNYGARIEELRLGSGQLTVKVYPLETKIENIVGKLYCEQSGSHVLQKDVHFDKPVITVPLDFVPDWWQFYVLSKDTSEVIDFRKVHGSWPSLPAGVVLEIAAADIEEMIKRGENERVEFKEMIKNPEYVETVVAFGNTYGGTLLVGVDDNGQIVGTFDEKLEERVRNQVRSACEPMPEITIEKKIAQEKMVFVIRVPEGKDKPYNYRDKGVFVRAGSTDRLATRIELDKMYEKRHAKSPYSAWYNQN